MQLFYSKDIASTLYLNKEESKHCSQVLRKKKNDIIFITDGNGFLYECEIQKIKTEKVDIKIIKSHQELRKKKLELAYCNNVQCSSYKSFCCDVNAAGYLSPPTK